MLPILLISNYRKREQLAAEEINAKGKSETAKRFKGNFETSWGKITAEISVLVSKVYQGCEIILADSYTF